MRSRLTIAALGLVLVASGCASRSSIEERRVAASRYLGSSGEQAAQPGAPADAAEPADTGPVPSGSADGTPTVDALSPAIGTPTGANQPSGAATGAASTGGATVARQSSTNAASAGPGQSKAATGTAQGGPATADPKAGQPSTPVASGPKSEIVMGSYGIETGVLAAVTGPTPPAIRAWVADVNRRGGLNGHPVRIIMAEDGGDPSRAQAIVRRMVEQDKVVAFFFPYAIGTLNSLLPYLEEKQVPVIGNLGSEFKADYSPISFQPLLGADEALGWAGILTYAHTQKKNLGIAYCREAAICAHFADKISQKLPYNGMKLVWTAQMSMAQPDYTAEMLAAQRAGVEALMVISDPSTIARMSQAARRQGYTPTFASMHQVANDALARYKEELDGTVVEFRVAPYDHPLMADYRAAMDRYQPKGMRGDEGTGAWVTGKLLEKVAATWGATVSSNDIMESLYALKNETLGGLLPGITFPRDKDRSKVNECIIPATLKDGQYVTDGTAFVCNPNRK